MWPARHMDMNTNPGLIPSAHNTQESRLEANVGSMYVRKHKADC